MDHVEGASLDRGDWVDFDRCVWVQCVHWCTDQFGQWAFSDARPQASFREKNACHAVGFTQSSLKVARRLGNIG